MCILSFTACLLKPQGILNSQGRFAFVSTSIPLVYTAKSQDIEFRNPSQWLRDMHEAVKKTNKPNYQEAHVTVPSRLQVPAWRQLVKYYDFKILAEYVEFGFPLGVDYENLNLVRSQRITLASYL